MKMLLCCSDKNSNSRFRSMMKRRKREARIPGDVLSYSIRGNAVVSASRLLVFLQA